MSGGAKYLPKLLPISFSGVYQDFWPSKMENPSVYWHATLSCPLMASNYMQICSDLILDADHALDSLSDLAFQAYISFYSVLDKSGA